MKNILTVLCTFLLLSATQQINAQPVPFDCDGSLYQYKGGEIMQIDMENETETQVATGDAYLGAARGYNVEDDLVYIYKSGYLCRMDANFNTTLIGNVAGGMITESGDFDRSGNLFIYAQGQLKSIDVDNPPFTAINYTLSGTTGLEVNDIAFNPADEKFYGVSINKKLVSISLTTNTTADISTISITGPLANELWLTDYGSAWFGQNGKFYTWNQWSGKFYQVDLQTGVSTLIFTTITSSFNDGFSCPGPLHVIDSNAFVTTWKTDNPGSSNSTSITIPVIGSAADYNYDIDWESDGVWDVIGANWNQTHDYGTAGTYTVSIRGVFPRIHFNNANDRRKILSIEQWGDIAWTNMAFAFYGCTNLTYNATDAPDFSNVISMVGMFKNATSFNGNLSNWNTSNVTNMREMFYNANSFNGDVSTWNTGNVTSMFNMFNSATSFNSDLSAWNTSSVINMNGMFRQTSSFNQNLGVWDMSAVINVNIMLENSALDVTNYDNTLIGWSSQSLNPNLTLGANSLRYCNALAERQSIIDNFGWTFIGDNQGNACNFLPVELMLFEGQVQEKGNLLSWQTASELNNKGFEIEKSTNAQDWETIAFITGQGSLSQINNYDFLDTNVKAGQIYYRLKQVNFDGEFEHSKVIVLKRNATKNLKVYPNPTRNLLNLEGHLKGNYAIVNILGQALKQGQLTGERQINVSDLKSGRYFIRLITADGNTLQTEFIKVN